jgi:hypothetical protein
VDIQITEKATLYELLFLLNNQDNLWNLQEVCLSMVKEYQMREQLLHYIWQYKLFNTKSLKTTCGNDLQIIDFGKYNTNGGADFWNAKVKIDDVLLAGNIELHVHASDWKLHKHQHDKKYNNVILHVVYFNDEKESHLPVLELNGRIPKILMERYEAMMVSQKDLICENSIAETDKFTLEKWKERLAVERLERKANEVLNCLSECGNDWEQVCYRMLGKYFGSHINKEPFEMLTRMLDYRLLMKHLDNSAQTEALLFGVAGLLNKDFVEIYPRELKQEYNFLKHKYELKQVQEHHWQFLRIRPVSFPTIRIAWFAQVIRQLPLLNKIISAEDPAELLDEISVSPYWENHYVLDKMSKPKPKRIGREFKTILQLNVFIPLIYAYGKFKDEEQYVDKAIQLLYNNPPEHNVKTHVFEKAGLSSVSALDTQALIEQYDQYCTQKRCLSCAIGHKILSTSSAETFAKNF